jgi:FtsP/CotA-like multicopper oxidase with cupredoxin domain
VRRSHRSTRPSTLQPAPAGPSWTVPNVTASRCVRPHEVDGKIAAHRHLKDADNPGRWMVHCHNVYHAEGGMMTLLGYQK